MKKIPVFLLITCLMISCYNKGEDLIAFSEGEKISIAESILKDKIKGAWAGQTIGVTYGGPTEFRFNGTMIQDYVPIPWNEGVIEWWYMNAPGLYHPFS